jgi:hypothetical protein
LTIVSPRVKAVTDDYVVARNDEEGEEEAV